MCLHKELGGAFRGGPTRRCSPPLVNDDPGFLAEFVTEHPKVVLYQ